MLNHNVLCKREGSPNWLLSSSTQRGKASQITLCFAGKMATQTGRSLDAQHHTVRAGILDHIVLCRKEGSPIWLQSGSTESHSAAGLQWVRLVSALAEMHSGRAYLCTAASAVVQQLCYYLQAEEDLSKSNVSKPVPFMHFLFATAL